MSTGIIGGNVKQLNVVALPVAPVSVAANTTAEQSFTLAGLDPKANVDINKPSFQAGLGIVNVRVIPASGSTASQLAITYQNNTASPIVPATETYSVLVAVPEGSVTATKVSF